MQPKTRGSFTSGGSHFWVPAHPNGPSYPSEDGDSGSVLPDPQVGGDSAAYRTSVPDGAEEHAPGKNGKQSPCLCGQVGGSSLKHLTEKGPEAESGLSRKCDDSVSQWLQRRWGPTC